MSGASENYNMGLNALKCTITGMGQGSWNFLAAAYHAAKWAEEEKLIIDLVAEYYPILCTCKDEAKEYS